MAEEDERHEPSTDQKGEDGAERQRDPAVPAYLDLLHVHPDPIGENGRQREQAEENRDGEERFHQMGPMGERREALSRLAKARGVLSMFSGTSRTELDGTTMGKTRVTCVVGPTERKVAFAIREAVFVDEQEIDLSLEFDGLDDDAEHLLATLDRRAVGTLRLRRIDDVTAKIERVAVLKDARGRAIGATLVRAALGRLRERGFGEARLHAQTYALDFYAKIGFIAYGDVFEEDGIAHRAMRMDITGHA